LLNNFVPGNKLSLGTFHHQTNTKLSAKQKIAALQTTILARTRKAFEDGT